MLDERPLMDEFDAEKLRPLADVAAPAPVALRPFPPTAGRAPPTSPPELRENVVPVLLELRPTIAGLDRPCAAPERAPEFGAADPPRFMADDREPFAEPKPRLPVPPGLENDRGAAPLLPAEL